MMGLFAFASCTLLSAALNVVEADGCLRVERDGRPLVDAIRVDNGKSACGLKHRGKTATDGAAVWNEWCDERDGAYRLEVGCRADGVIEITMAGEAVAGNQATRRFLELDLPSGVFGDVGPKDSVTTNWFAANGIVFDFNPIGRGDDFGWTDQAEGWAHVDSVRAFGTIQPQTGGRYRVRMGSEITAPYGGYVGAKLLIRLGADADYDRWHFLRSFHYSDELKARPLVAFASPKRGERYAEGDVDFSAAGGYGWLNRSKRMWKSVGHSEGAFYSALCGEGDAVYRFGNLSDGWYLLTYAAGNFIGEENHATVIAGDWRILDGATVERGNVRRLTRAVHVVGGTLDVAFSGRWLVSSLALQPVLTDAEDFSVKRGFWLTSGFEPGTIYRSVDWLGPVRLAVSDHVEQLPEPGRECEGMARMVAAPVELPDRHHPGVAWMKHPVIKRLYDNGSTFAGLSDDDAREKAVQRDYADCGVTAVMLSGLLSRFTFQKRSCEAVGEIRKLVESFHRRNIRVIDHIDVTLCWNEDAGFRWMLEHPDELNRRMGTDLPAYQRCASNPLLAERHYPYFREIAKAGVDGFQVDELYMWLNGCVCSTCRRRFHEDTGWQMPMNECDSRWTDRQSPFFRKWLEWRYKTCTNWLVGLRRYLADVNDHLAIGAYPTYWSFMTTWSGDFAQQVEDLTRVVNFFGVEVMSRCFLANLRTELAGLRAANIYSDAHGTAPVWHWYYNFDWQNDYAAWAVSSMLGGTPFLSVVPKASGVPDYPSFSKRIAEIERQGAEPVAEVGLYFSSRTRDASVKRLDMTLENAKCWRGSLLAAAEALDRSHVPYRFVADFDLTAERLYGLKVLILSGGEQLDPHEQSVFISFERQGGRILRGTAADGRYHCPYVDTLRPYSYNVLESEERRYRERLVAKLGSATWWQTDAPTCVYTSVRKLADGGYTIQFLNASGVVNRVGEVPGTRAPKTAFAPLENDILCRIPAACGNGVVAESPDFAGTHAIPSCLTDDGWLEFTLPRRLLKVYTLVRIGIAGEASFLRAGHTASGKQ